MQPEWSPMKSHELSHQFAIQYLSSLPEEENGAASPIGLFVCLSLAKLGAEGDTLSEFIELIGDDAENTEALVKQLAYWNDEKFELKFANGVFVRNGITLNKSFEKKLKNSFSALSRNVDFGTEAGGKVINDWIKKQTNGLLGDVIGDTSNVLAILVNALYMKGKWVKKFSLSQMSPDFRTSTGDIVKPQMMEKECLFDYYTDPENKFRVAFFEYEIAKNPAGKWEMGVLLPDPNLLLGSNSKIADFLNFISPENLKKFKEYNFYGMDSRLPTKLDVLLPKVKIVTDINLIPLLQKMGLSSAFSADKADFSGMT